jgi:hypothetical protein
MQPLTRQPLQVHLTLRTATFYNKGAHQLRCDSTARLQESNEWDRLFTLQHGSEYHCGDEFQLRSLA